jgi:hypothetical protein
MLRQKDPGTNELTTISARTTPQRYTQQRDDTFSSIGCVKMDFFVIVLRASEGGGVNFGNTCFFTTALHSFKDDKARQVLSK